MYNATVAALYREAIINIMFNQGKYHKITIDKVPSAKVIAPDIFKSKKDDADEV